MIKEQDCLYKYGAPELEKNMTLLKLQSNMKLNGVIPGRIYCNKDFVKPFLMGLQYVKDFVLEKEIKTWDGCFNIRRSKGGNAYSLHSWGVAFDINAESNGYGNSPQMSKKLVRCFTMAGFEWGGDWQTPDGMHFQLSKI